MTIHGVGIDVVDTQRVERLVARSAPFPLRWFTTREVAQCSGVNGAAREYAQRLAAKEAVWKALGLDAWSGGVPWRHIETSPDGVGFTVRLTGPLAAACVDAAIGVIRVAYAHRPGCVVAIAVVEGAT